MSEERLPLDKVPGILIRTTVDKPSAVVNEHVSLDHKGVETVVDAVVAHFEGQAMMPTVMSAMHATILSELLRQGFQLKNTGEGFFEPMEYWVRVRMIKYRKFIVEVRWVMEGETPMSATGQLEKLYPEEI